MLGRTRAQAEYKVRFGACPLPCASLHPPGNQPCPPGMPIPALQELLGTLRALSDPELAAWAAQHRERLSLPFLGWLSEEELATSSDEPDQQQQLWELGSKLMALREGLSPVGNEVLQAELRAAALRCSSGGSSSSGGASGGDGSDDDDEEDYGGQQQQQRRRQDAQQPPPAAAAAAASTALATPAFTSAVSAAAALGLSPEGMSLFQQQAAALEAVVGTSRATSLTEVIGRVKVQDQRQLQGLAESDAAVSGWAGVCGAPLPCSCGCGRHCWHLPYFFCSPLTLRPLPCGTAALFLLAFLLSCAGSHPGCAAERAGAGGAGSHAVGCLHAPRQHRG